MKTQKLRSILFILLVALLVGAVLFYLFKLRDSKTTGSNPPNQNETIDYSPPTVEEKKSGDQKKEEITGNDSSSGTTSDNSATDSQANSKQDVKPIITSAGQYGDKIEVRAFMPNVYENNGNCTVAFTKDNNKIERQVEGIQDATTTRCDTVAILREDFPSSGTWTVKVTYNSPSSQGVSDESSFEVN